MFHDFLWFIDCFGIRSAGFLICANVVFDKGFATGFEIFLVTTNMCNRFYKTFKLEI